MAETALAMGIVLSSWAALLAGFVGIGALVSRALRLAGGFWLGWACTILALQVWHLFFAVDARFLVLFFCAGAAGLRLARPWPAPRWATLALCAVAAVWLANRALPAPRNLDSGLYHFQTIQWLSAHPIVLGLGLVHDRLAFNQSYFLYAAMLDVGPFAHRGHNLANGLLLLVLFWQTIDGAVSWIRRRGRIEPRHAVGALFLPAVVDQALHWNVSSPTPDVAVFALGFVIALTLVEMLERAPSPEGLPGRRGDLLALALLAGVGITVKLSLAGLAIAAMIAAAALWLRRGGAVRALGLAGGLALAALAPWALRGLLQSGYPAYPSTLGALDVAWRVPEEVARAQSSWVWAWGRRPGLTASQVGDSWDWLGPWLWQASFQNREVLLPLGLALFGLGWIAVRRLRRRAPVRPTSWLALAPAVGGLVFWFAASPDVRFAGACFWLLGAQCLVLALDRVGGLESARAAERALLLCAVLAAWPLFGPDPVWLGGGFGAVPAMKGGTFRTASGLELRRPERTSCWDAPIPCTPFPDARLRLRRDGDLAAGFVLGP